MNLPNKLSIFRIILVPILAITYLSDIGSGVEIDLISNQINLTQLISLIIFVVASVTDLIDGYLARKLNAITSFGKFIDPIADKLLVNTMLILLSLSGKCSVVAVLIMIWRDIMVDGMRMMAAKEGVVVAAHFSGKLKTVTQMVAIIGIFLIPFVGEVLIWISAIFSIYSGIEYFRATKEIIMESK